MRFFVYIIHKWVNLNIANFSYISRIWLISKLQTFMYYMLQSQENRLEYFFVYWVINYWVINVDVKEKIKLLAYLYYSKDCEELKTYTNNLSKNEIFEIYTACRIGEIIKTGLNSGKVIKNFNRTKYFLNQREYYKYCLHEREIRNELKTKLKCYIYNLHYFVEWF
ncbi:hypothetical protein B5723_03085 [Mammaliicoccus sciuri]|nr:hypothetical protein B5723_03085 [Mammaliicoccus sciuri]